MSITCDNIMFSSFLTQFENGYNMYDDITIHILPADNYYQNWCFFFLIYMSPIVEYIFDLSF